MPMDRDRYPADWQRIALAKKEAVGWRCGYVTGIIARMHKYCPECGRKVKE